MTVAVDDLIRIYSSDTTPIESTATDRPARATRHRQQRYRMDESTAAIPESAAAAASPSPNEIDTAAAKKKAEGVAILMNTKNLRKKGKGNLNQQGEESFVPRGLK
mmetsp:Transcript_11819/g.25921  ORF Transcript_11819/g.25921 Transcript_11819/m.25921 type:complete len:106 (+) Transcript_11819:176-493(+)